MTTHAFHPDERAGIWIDSKCAFLIRISSDHSPIVEKIESGIESRNTDPAEEKSFERLAQSAPNHHDALQHHKQQQLHQFFESLIKQLKGTDYLFLMGPGDTKLALNKAIEHHGVHFPCKVVGIEAADKMSQNQMKEKVRHFFTSLKYEDAVRRLKLELN